MTDRENTHLPLHPPPQNPNDLRDGEGDDEDTQYEHDTQSYEIWIPFNGRRDDDFTIEIDADGNQTGIIKFYRPDARELQQSVVSRPDRWPIRGGIDQDRLEAEEEGVPDRPRPKYQSPEEVAESHALRQAEKQRQIDEASIRDRDRARARD